MAQYSFRQKIETFIVVTVITVLVWLYAEGRNVTEYVNEPIRVQFVPADDSGFTVSPDDEQRIQITYEGSTATKQALEALLDSGPIKIPIAEDDPAEVIFQTRRNESKLADLGIQVTRVEPERRLVKIRRVVTVTMPIDVRVEGVELTGVPTVEPREVAVKLPSTLADLARELPLEVTLTAADLSSLRPGEPGTVQAKVALPEVLRGQDVDLPIRAATVALTIRKQTRTITLTSVPIHLNLPPLLLDQYRIRLPDDQQVLREVQLTGPADGIHEIESKQCRVWAEIRPSAEDLEADPYLAQLHLRIPAGVRVDSPIPRVPVIVEAIQ